MTTTVTYGASKTISFDVAYSEHLFSTNAAAFDNLAGSSTGEFDLGVPFFLGRQVFLAIAGAGTPGGTGPYWAY